MGFAVTGKNVDDYFKNKQIDYVIHCQVSNNRTAEDGPDLSKKIPVCSLTSVKTRNILKRGYIFVPVLNTLKNIPTHLKKANLAIHSHALLRFSKYIISKYIKNTDNIYCLRLFGVFGPGEELIWIEVYHGITKDKRDYIIKIFHNFSVNIKPEPFL